MCYITLLVLLHNVALHHVMCLDPKMAKGL
jgi:hypothetical protein